MFYDAACPLCVRGVARVGGLFARRGFEWVPLQTPGTPERLGTTEAGLSAEMKLLRADGCVLGGADAWAALFRSVWWLWVPGVLLMLPGFNRLGRAAYRWLARHRYCFSGACATGIQPRSPDRHHRHAAFFELP